MPTYRIHPHTRERMEYLRDVASAVERAVTGESSSSVSIALPACDVAAVSEAIGEYGRILRASEDVVARALRAQRIERSIMASERDPTWALFRRDPTFGARRCCGPGPELRGLLWRKHLRLS